MNKSIQGFAGGLLVGVVSIFLPGCPPASKADVPKTPALTIHWEKLLDDGGNMNFVGSVHRTKVPSGWIVHDVRNSPAMVYVPDPKHEWLAEKPEAEK